MQTLIKILSLHYIFLINKNSQRRKKRPPIKASADLRVVVVYVDAMCHGLLQRKEVNCLPLQYICGGCEELVKAPTLFLVSLHYTC